MIILGLDPGSQKFGYALIQTQGNNFQQMNYIHSGIINLTKINGQWEKMKIVHKQALELLNKFNPEHVAIEGTIFHKNPQTLIKLAQIKIAFCGPLLGLESIQFYEYLPTVVKKANTGLGHATKNLLAKRLKTQTLDKNHEFESFDESDALAVAFCHFLHLGSL